ncbi:MAG TPA: hypothetical protein DCM38_13235 [Gammaproteobacteria bacterium]|nr:hypothetical protein [Gammaproteobacteria bacterium]
MHNNPFFACIQLLYWLLFRPVAWQTLVEQIDLSLPADFALSRLSIAQWRHPIVLRLLVLIYGVGPLLVGILVGVCLWLIQWGFGWQDGGAMVIRGILYAATLTFVGGLISGITVSLAFAYVASLISGLLVGCFFWIPEDEQWYRVAILFGVFAVSVASRVLLTLATLSVEHQVIQKGGSLIISLLVTAVIFSGAVVVSGAILYISLQVVYYTLLMSDTIGIAGLDPHMMGLGVGIGFAYGLYTRRWFWAAILVLVIGVTMTVLISGPETDIETEASLLTILVKPVVGGISNGLLFALLFALPYLLARYIANAWTGIVAGLLGSGGVYVGFFMMYSEKDIFFFSFMVLGLGLSYPGWRYLLDKPVNHWGRVRRLGHWIGEFVTAMLGSFVRRFTLFFQAGLFESISQFLTLKREVHNISRQIAETTSNEKIDNPYITGVPLTKYNQELFVGRDEVIARLELLLQNPRSPPILLYGQRRMGKTSLLNFLNALLPDHYVPLFVDFQGPVSLATDHSHFFYSLSRAMIRNARKTHELTLPPLSREDLQADPFSVFDEWLDDIEACVAGRTVLLTFDEFEALEKGFNQGNLNRQAILGFFRHIIQHRLQFKIIIAGVHQLEAFPDWANYLINTETVELSYLLESEARQLIENPVKKALRYTPDATQRILALTRCHPALVQLLCKEIVLFKNGQAAHKRRWVQQDEVEAIIANSLKSGRNYFSHISNRSAAEQALLHVLAKEGEGAVLSQKVLAEACQVESIEETLSHLVQSGFIESTPLGYRFQVELIRRWFLSMIRNFARKEPQNKF